MSAFTQPERAGIRQSPSNLSLGSNNPFRNRTTSPSIASPSKQPPRPVSRNPFLDLSITTPTLAMSSPEQSPFLEQSSEVPKKSPLVGIAAELFDNVTPETEEPKPNHGSLRMRLPIRAHTSNVQPPPYMSVMSENVKPPGHRSSRSQEEAMRARRAAARTSSKSKDGELNIFADPGDESIYGPRPRERPDKARRNSESSIASKAIDLKEENRRRERRKQRGKRYRERSEGNQKLDVIDKLDKTGFGFHHDGPYDACRANRNGQDSRRAPMHAFAKGSLNNIIGGGGPVNKQANHDKFLMRNEEDAFNDYGQGGRANSGYEPYGEGRPGGLHRTESHVISATSRVEPIHGDESLGLGTSTFLEGAPASRTAVMRKEAEAREQPLDGGLGRKKSLAQKIRGINQRREYGPAGRVTTPAAMNMSLGSPESPLYTPGGHKSEANPFFNEFVKGDDAKITGTVGTAEPVGRLRAPSSPKRFVEGKGLERRITGDGAYGEGKSNGFLSRVKSLKGTAKKNQSQGQIHGQIQSQGALTPPAKPLPEPTGMAI